MDNYGVLLAKILPRERVQSTLDGEIYMNEPSIYPKVDSSDAVRFDPFEDYDMAQQVKSISIQDPSNGEWVPIGGIMNPILSRYDNRPNVHVYCMHGIKNLPDYNYDVENNKFGDSAIVISNLIEFVARFKRAARNKGYGLSQAPVTYVDRKYDGDMGPFKKFDTFAYQHEFRFVLLGAGFGPETLNIGDIRDISFPILVTEMPKLIERMNRTD